MPKQVICELESLSPYQQNKPVVSERLEKETHDEHEKRTWQERAHVNEQGFIIVPAMALKHSIAEAAKFLGSSGSLKISGGGKATYTKHLKAGVLPGGDLVTKFKLKEVRPYWLFVPSNGIHGSGARVNKCFPVLNSWAGHIEFVILDDTVTKEVFERVFREAGNFIGIGGFRPSSGGYFGRFRIVSFKWSEIDLLKMAA